MPQENGEMIWMRHFHFSEFMEYYAEVNKKADRPTEKSTKYKEKFLKIFNKLIKKSMN